MLVAAGCVDVSIEEYYRPLNTKTRRACDFAFTPRRLSVLKIHRKDLGLSQFSQHQHVVTMSSPTSRRSNRNSVGGTPRRNRNSTGPMSDASLPGSDPANQQQGTPRARAQSSSQNTSQSQQQAPPTSSPLFFRSSPAGSQSQSQSQSLNVPNRNGVNGSSPLRQRNDQTSSQGGQTPRASGQIGAGKESERRRSRHSANQLPRVFTDSLCYQLRCRRTNNEWPETRPNELHWLIRALAPIWYGDCRSQQETRHQF